MLLKVVADAGNVGRHFDAVGQAHARDLAEGRVRLLRGLREHADADAALLRAVLQRGALRLGQDPVAALANKLADRRHVLDNSSHARDTRARENIACLAGDRVSRPAPREGRNPLDVPGLGSRKTARHLELTYPIKL